MAWASFVALEVPVGIIPSSLEDEDDEELELEEEELESSFCTVAETVTPASLHTSLKYFCAASCAFPQFFVIESWTSCALHTAAMSWGLDWVFTAPMTQAGGAAKVRFAREAVKRARVVSLVVNIVAVGGRSGGICGLEWGGVAPAVVCR